MTYNIPKIAHFVWGNPSGFPLSRVLSVATFAYHNPTFQIKIHLFDSSFSKNEAGFRGGEQSGISFKQDYSNKLGNLNNISIVNHRCSDYGLDPKQPPAFMSDRLRYYILHNEGGYYFDTDIIFFAPLEDSYLFSQLHFHVNFILSSSGIFHGEHRAFRIGFMGSAKKCNLMKRIYELSYINFDPTEYQSCGAPCVQMAIGGALRKGSSSLNSEIFPEVYIHNVLDSFYYRFSSESMSKVISPKIFISLTKPNPWFNGIHWYGGLYAKKIDTMSLDALCEGLNSNEERKFVEHILDYAIYKTQALLSTRSMLNPKILAL